MITRFRLAHMCLVGLTLFAAANLHAVGKKISENISFIDTAFDPWDTTKWSDWYDADGHLIKSFIIDQSVTFATPPGAVDWAPTLPASGAPTVLFEIIANSDIVVDGNNCVIDVTTAETGIGLEDYYINSRDSGGYVLDATVWPNFICFQVEQPSSTSVPVAIDQPTLPSAPTSGSKIHNLTIRGFKHGVATAHGHQRQILLTDLIIQRCKWAIYPRGLNGYIYDNTLTENFSGAIYAEYNSQNWVINDNYFRDNAVNNKIQSFGDVVIDSCSQYVITNNDFVQRTYSHLQTTHQTAISLFRNTGENKDIREVAPHNIRIDYNDFTQHKIAVDVAARMGVSDIKDMSLEGRSLAYDIYIENNTFNDCRIGIKINGNYCDIIDNTFDADTDVHVAIHCVLYHTIGHHVENNISIDPIIVELWSKQEDYTAYKDYCRYQNDGGNAIYESIDDSDKLFHVTTSGVVTLNEPTRASFTAQVVNAASLAVDTSVDPLVRNLSDMYASGATPKDIAFANYVDDSPGDEIAVIWNEANSTLNEYEDTTHYYSIIIYDQWGNELDRCGRSTAPWERIAGGNMLPGKGHIHIDEEAEIAAIPSYADSEGKYPIYIFRRGFAKDDEFILSDHIIKLAPNMGKKMIDITVGNFRIDASGDDGYDEVAVIFDSVFGDNDYTIRYRKPTDTGWLEITEDIPYKLQSISAGNLDVTTSVDEVAGVYAEDASLTAYPILFFKPAVDGAYLTNPGGSSNNYPWDQIAVGDFEPNYTGLEIAVTSNKKLAGAHRINFYRYNALYTKQFNDPVFSVPFAAIDAADIEINTAVVSESDLALEEVFKVNTGPLPANLSTEINSWGAFLGVLPSTAQSTSVPAFLINVNPSASNGSYLRNIPIYR
ncbi:hypothetical protein QEH59_15445 [Coraliomargarita sp. SDUM461004]|uniref:Right handed beta helix domain-containing protein n=1 Tax=Thalassobacterium sedimentorum TaxID=3041258 RepID=A0ABU1ALZ6_9BACT|nr:hypothetical protein [Coraliomargarita sp. SDUM461004]MDQ8195827.1 hypothetical protein [Coraliomargarita sp. SDUM461004]